MSQFVTLFCLSILSAKRQMCRLWGDKNRIKPERCENFFIIFVYHTNTCNVIDIVVTESERNLICSIW